MQAQSVPFELVYLLLEQPMKSADIQREHCQHKKVETQSQSCSFMRFSIAMKVTTPEEWANRIFGSDS